MVRVTMSVLALSFGTVALAGGGGDVFVFDPVNMGGPVGIGQFRNEVSLGVTGQAAVAAVGTVVSTGTEVIGTDTTFTTALRPGAVLVVAGQRQLVLSVESDFALTTVEAFSPPVTDEPFAVLGSVAGFSEEGGAVALEVNALGDVGIGTGLPAAKLHVVGDLMVDGAVSGQAPLLLETETIEVDSADKVFAAAECRPGSVTVAMCEATSGFQQSCLCGCVDSPNEHGLGWYCVN